MILVLSATLAVMTVLAGCRVGYIMHAAVGEARLLANAVPIPQALTDGSLNPSQKERLLLVSDIKAFGEKELGLKKTSSYENIYIGSAQPPIYTIVAAPKDRLALKTWWFPVVGTMPYLGFFDLEDARDEREKLLQEGLDVVIGRAEAFSTLGWFSDPLTLNLIDGSEVDLAEIILHEMTHTTLYVKGQGAFNEGLAQIIGKRGAFLFLEKYRGPTHPHTIEAMAAIEDERLFSLFLNSVLEELQRLYGSDLPPEEKLRRRQDVFTRCRQDFESLKSRFKTRRFIHFDQAPLNNAYLMALSLYHRNFPLFEAVLDQSGHSLRAMLLLFRTLSEQEGDLLEMARRRVAK
jgi:predicted aminopeptidase